MDIGSLVVVLVVLVGGVILFMSKGSISSFFSNLGNSAKNLSESVTGVTTLDSSQVNSSQIAGQQVIKNINNTGQSAISGESFNLTVFPHVVKSGSATFPLNQLLQDKASSLGRPLTLAETKQVIADYNNSVKATFLSLGGVVA